MNGSRLQQIREALGLSQDELADIVRVSARLVNAWEHGARPIPAVVERMVTRFVAHGLANFAPN